MFYDTYKKREVSHPKCIVKVTTPSELFLCHTSVANIHILVCHIVTFKLLFVNTILESKNGSGQLFPKQIYLNNCHVTVKDSQDIYKSRISTVNKVECPNKLL